MEDKRNDSDSSSPKNKARRWTLAGIAAATIAATGAAFAWHGGAHAQGGFGGHAHFGGPFSGSFSGKMDPESMGRRIDAMVQWMLADVDATPEQREKIAGIAKAAASELAPLRTQHRDARRKMIELLAQPTIDRAQFERVRVEQMQLGETVTKRVTQAMLDAAEVLTPDQRAKLAQKWQERQERRGHGRRG
ncbi:MAG TPA: periplasmic heavy metal sensor [Burkholderiaceae bacterium]|nr:periplasmic heavy metal sensor [Burkholderiaceae bacterium]